MNMKKRVLIILLIFIIVILAAFLVVTLVTKIKKENDKKTTQSTTVSNRYDMLVSINPLVKLVFEIDPKCKDAQVVCIQTSSKVVDYDLINNDAKEIYKDLDFNGKTVYDSIVALCDEAKANNINVKDITITSSYNINDNTIKDYVKENSANKIDLIITYEHREIDIHTSTTTSTTVETTDTTTTTTTSANNHDGYINLNDNVKVSIKEPCGMYYKVIDECFDKTIGELKTRYPGYKTGALSDLKDMMEFDDNTKSNEVIKKYPLSFTEVFPACSSGLDTQLCTKQISGAYTTCRGNGLDIHYLETSNSKYKDYFKGNDILTELSNNKMYYEARCGGESNESKILNEELCNKYYLKCDRW